MTRSPKRYLRVLDGYDYAANAKTFSPPLWPRTYPRGRLSVGSKRTLTTPGPSLMDRRIRVALGRGLTAIRLEPDRLLSDFS